MRVVLVLFSVLLSLVQSDEQCSTDNGDFVAKRIKMKNKSNFARVSGIELTKELGRSSTRSLETCGQLCDESLACLAFEFDRAHSLCITASAYYLMDAHTLNTEIMETIKFIKLQNKYVSFKRGETEACINDGKYKQIAQGQVVQWLKDHASSRPKEETSTKSSPTIVHSTSTTSDTSAPDAASTPQSHFTNGTSSSLTSSSPKETPSTSSSGTQPTTVASTVTQKVHTVTSTTTSKPGNNLNTTSKVSSSTTTPEAVTVISTSTEAKTTPTTTSSTSTTSSEHGSREPSKATSSPLGYTITPTQNTATSDLTPVTESGDNSTSEEATVRLLPTVTTTKGKEEVKSTVGVESTDGGSTMSNIVTLTEDTVEITESSAQIVESSTTEQVNPTTTTQKPITTFTDTTVDWSMVEREGCARFCWSNKWMCELCRTTYPDDFDDQTTLAPTTTTTVTTTTTSRPLGVATSSNTAMMCIPTAGNTTTCTCGLIVNRAMSMRVDCGDNWATGIRLMNDSNGWWVLGWKDEQKYLICDAYANVSVTCKPVPFSVCIPPVVVRGEYAYPTVKCADSAKFDRAVSTRNNTCTDESVMVCRKKNPTTSIYNFYCPAFPSYLLAVVYCA